MLSWYASARSPVGDGGLPDANALCESQLTAAVLNRAIQMLDSLHTDNVTRSCSEFNTNEANKSRLIHFMGGELHSLGQRVAFARKRKGLSQPELARKVSVRQSTIGNIEAGTRVRPRKLMEIAEALGVTQRWLLTGALPMEAPLPTLSAREARAVYGAEGLTELERVMIQLFRQARSPVQQQIIQILIAEIGIK